MKIKYSELRSIVISAFTKTHYTKFEAAKIADVLLYAELVKPSQGVVKLIGNNAIQNIKPVSEPKVIKETMISAMIDGGGAVAILIAQDATDKAIEIAKKSGIAIVTTTNTASSTGSVGFYARKIAQAGFIGITAAGSPKRVTHFGGADSIYGTNPIAFSFPTLSEPVVFDMATSAMTFYGVIRAKATGDKLPAGVAVDKNGNPTTDPSAMLDGGSLLPLFNSYKGSGLALAVEMLCGPLAGADYSFQKGNWGNFFLALDPEVLCGSEQFRKNASDLVGKVAAGKTLSGKANHVPGVGTEKILGDAAKRDEIELDEKLYDGLKRTVLA